MQTVIIHLQRVSYFRPVLVVEAVIEIRLVRRVFVIAVDPQIHFISCYFDPFRFKFPFNAWRKSKRESKFRFFRTFK